MGIFQSKQPKKKSPSEEAAEVAASVFDDRYREELRRSGRKYFKNVIDESAVVFKKDLDTMVAHVGVDLKQYMTKQLDATIAQLGTEMTKHLEKRLAEYDTVTKDAHTMAVKSLNSSAHALHLQYEKLGAALQKSITGQEAMMKEVYEDNKAQIAATKEAQETALKSLNDGVRDSEKQNKQFSVTLQQSIAEQEKMLTVTFKESSARIDATKDAQEAALTSLNQSAKSLREQYEQLGATLKQNVADQESILVDAFEKDMAQVIEHYLLDALSEQYDMKAQVPSIIKQMEANKQAIMDDMKL